MSWEIYTRGTIHLHRFDAPIRAHVDVFKNKNIFPGVIYANIGKKLWWAWNKEDTSETAKYIFNQCRSSSGQRKFFGKMSEIALEAIKSAEVVKNINLEKCSNQEIANLYDYLYKHIYLAHALMNYDIDVIDAKFNEFFQEKIRKNLPRDFNLVKFDELYNKLTVSTYPTFLNQQEIAILKVAKSKKIIEKAKLLYKKFWWTSLGWESMRAHDINFFIREIKKYQSKSPEKKLKDISKRTKDIGKQRSSLLRKYDLPKEISYWLKVIDKFTYFHELRKEMQVKTIHSVYLLMLEVSRRFNIGKSDLLWYWIAEAKELLLKNKKVNQAEITRRKRAVYVLIRGGKIKFLSGQVAINEKNKELKENIKRVTEFKGVGASVGRVKGKVKVCAGAQEALKKIKKGDILVTGMTVPEYLPALKKAKAIITDEGGITAHAAIISRELGIPCIVGTKIATKVLRDGQLVEVDANRGIVRIL